MMRDRIDIQSIKHLPPPHYPVVIVYQAPLPQPVQNALDSMSRHEVDRLLLAAVALLLAFIVGLALSWLENRKLRSKLRNETETSAQAQSKMETMRTRAVEIERQFGPHFDAEQHLKDSAEALSAQNAELDELRERYRKGRATLQELEREAAVYEESLDLIEMGFHKSVFEFTATEAYTDAIKKVRDEQKQMAKEKTAIDAPFMDQVTADGSKTKGKQMLNRAIRMTLRAFNHECDSIIQKVRWSNFERSEARIVKSSEQLDKMNKSLGLSISRDYVSLKNRELTLAFERELKKKEDRERKMELLREQREAQRVEREINEALDDEERIKERIEQARVEASKSSQQESERLKLQVSRLEAELQSATDRANRAKSMAQQTRAGHVYVISNIGSFGEDVFKIGMTRRVDPDLRVRELGDASVPFLFDVHAMVFSNDAPSLESELHRQFSDRRVNLVNSRKEFFRVPLEVIRDAVIKLDSDAEFYLTAEAEQFRESEALRVSQLNPDVTEQGRAEPRFPEDL